MYLSFLRIWIQLRFHRLQQLQSSHHLHLFLHHHRHLSGRASVPALLQLTQCVSKVWCCTGICPSDLVVQEMGMEQLSLLSENNILKYFNFILKTTWKEKYQSMDNTNNGKGKGKLLPKNEEISRWKKHTETYLKFFDNHSCLSQSEESKCMWTHGKYSHWEFYNIKTIKHCTILFMNSYLHTQFVLSSRLSPGINLR